MWIITDLETGKTEIFNGSYSECYNHAESCYYDFRIEKNV